MTEGWKCPNCGKAHAPHIDTCPEPGRVTITSTFYPRVFHDGPTPPVFQADWPHWPPHLPTVTCSSEPDQ